MTLNDTVDNGTVVRFVDLGAQHSEVAEEIEAGLRRVIAATAFVDGPEVAEFEREWAAYCGVAQCVSVGNGTDAIELGLRAAGIGRGHEVIVPANTFIATAEAVTRAGARPVFVDCDDTYLLVDPLFYNHNLNQILHSFC